MPISGTTSDYTNRTKDVLILGPVDALSAEIQNNDMSFGKPSRFCAGIQKLCQRYLIMLLTDLGSQTSYPTFGTNFLKQVKLRNSSLSKVDVEHLFNASSLKVLNQLRTYQSKNPDLPLDEQINTAFLEELVIEKDSASIKIRLSSLAGDDIVFLTPLPD